METILLVDDDLAFVFWLGRILDAEGYAAFPAKSADDGRNLVAQCRLAVDLLIINKAIVGLSTFIKDLRVSQPSVEILVVVDPASTDSLTLDPSDTVLRKPERLDAVCRDELLASVQNVISRSKQMKTFGHLA